jgi:hypothetical protein
MLRWDTSALGVVIYPTRICLKVKKKKYEMPGLKSLKIRKEGKMKIKGKLKIGGIYEVEYYPYTFWGRTLDKSRKEYLTLKRINLNKKIISFAETEWDIPFKNIISIREIEDIKKELNLKLSKGEC